MAKSSYRCLGFCWRNSDSWCAHFCQHSNLNLHIPWHEILSISLTPCLTFPVFNFVIDFMWFIFKPINPSSFFASPCPLCVIFSWYACFILSWNFIRLKILTNHKTKCWHWYQPLGKIPILLYFCWKGFKEFRPFSASHVGGPVLSTLYRFSLFSAAKSFCFLLASWSRVSCCR